MCLFLSWNSVIQYWFQVYNSDSVIMYITKCSPQCVVTICHTKISIYIQVNKTNKIITIVLTILILYAVLSSLDYFIIGSLYLFFPFTCFTCPSQWQPPVYSVFMSISVFIFFKVSTCKWNIQYLSFKKKKKKYEVSHVSAITTLWGWQGVIVIHKK